SPQLAVHRQERLEIAAPDLLFTLEEELHVEWERTSRREERLSDFDRDEHRSLVVRDAARIEAAVADLRLERRALPPLEWIGRLHVVVPVDQKGRSVRRAEPLAVHHRVAGRRDDADVDRT